MRKKEGGGDPLNLNESSRGVTGTPLTDETRKAAS